MQLFTSGLPSTLTDDGSGNLTFTGRWINARNGGANAPANTMTGTWFTGGTSTTTKPHFLIEPTGTTSTSWSTAGTGLGVNAPSGFTGNLATFGINGTERMRITAAGDVGIGTASPSAKLEVLGQLRVNNAPDADVLYFKGGPGGASSTAGLAFDATAAAFGSNVSARINFIYDNSFGANISFENRTGSQGTTTTQKMVITTAGNVGIGTTTPTALLDINGDTMRLRTARTPASATATGSVGDQCWDASYIYICTATNTWKRAAIATW